jgi:type VI secretion system secreted protein VgrG
MYTQEGRPLRVDTPLGSDVLLLEHFSADEGISQPYSLQLTMLSTEDSLPLDDLLQSPVVVSLQLADGSTRYFHGLVREVEQGETEGDLTTYTAEAVPWFWFLSLNSNCRVYKHDQTVRQILEDVFARNGYQDYQFQLFNDYDPREYCVQYRETDLDFVSRLMEEEGLYYYFNHTQDKHTLTITDDTAGLATIADLDVRYHQEQSGTEDPDVVTHLNAGHSVATAVVSLNDYDFEKPSANLEVQASGDGWFERYDYPGSYVASGTGEKLAKLHLQSYRWQTNRVMGFATHREFAAGSTFELLEHPRSDLNQKYSLLRVSHSAGPNGYRSGDDTGGHYSNHFEAIPASLPFRAPRVHAKPYVRGVQTAVVVGTKGEEFQVDRYGRVKVQFYWDREGNLDGENSCWVRVSQNWAGKGWGAMQLPRIGQEVIVDFLEGDPDRPIITGRVYNGEQMPPYALPAEQTKTTFKTNSSKGGGGFNEIRLEDKKGSEQIFIHAERDHETRVKNDLVETVLGERHEHVTGADYLKLDADSHLTIGGDRNEKVTGTISRQAGQDVEEKAGNNYAMDAGMEIHLKAGMTAVIEAGTSLTLKVGGNFINIGPAGVYISGIMVMINSGGSAGSGSGSSPQTPKSPRDAVDADAGQVGVAPTLTQVPDRAPPRPKVFSPEAQGIVNAQKSAAPFHAVCNHDCEACAGG